MDKIVLIEDDPGIRTVIRLALEDAIRPVAGALVHNAGSVLVVLNAALLYDRKFR